MTLEEFEKLANFYANSTILSEETKDLMIQNLIKKGATENDKL